MPRTELHLGMEWGAVRVVYVQRSEVGPYDGDKVEEEYRLACLCGTEWEINRTWWKLYGGTSRVRDCGCGGGQGTERVTLVAKVDVRAMGELRKWAGSREVTISAAVRRLLRFALEHGELVE